jgi:hypothetical protein
MIFYSRTEAYSYWKGQSDSLRNRTKVVKDRHWSIEDDDWRECWTIVMR